MSPEHPFSFHCDRGIPCFTRCCRDVTISLTPYDVLRLKRALSISSDDFLEEYTVVIPKPGHLIPLVLIKMSDGDKKCPFVAQNGCTLYEDRPWACRMFPLDQGDDGTFHLITDIVRCLGLLEKEDRSIGDWIFEQGIELYDEMNALFAEITIPLRSKEPGIDNPQITKMLFMTLYNLDRFRDFIFGSTFLDRFDVDPSRVERIKKRDEELLEFGFDWVKFGVFGQKLFSVKDSVQGGTCRR